MLCTEAPELFTGDFKVITEFGRRLLAKAGVLGESSVTNVTFVDNVDLCVRVWTAPAGLSRCIR
jgi:hypothetical protein